MNFYTLEDEPEPTPPQRIEAMARPIYGQDRVKDDNRVDPAIVTSASNITPFAKAYIDRIVNGTVCFIGKQFLKKEADGTYTITKRQTYGSLYKLCPSERFWDQPVAAYCTGVIVSPTLVLSAGHCASKNRETFEFGNESFVMITGYQMVSGLDAKGNAVVKPRMSGFTEAEVFHDYEIIDGRLGVDTNDNFIGDWSLIKIKQKTFDPSRIMSVNLGEQLTINEKVFCMGYPSGLPVKMTSLGTVGKRNDVFYTTNLDTFSSNSGSPIFSYARIGVVFALLYSGETDFVPDTANTSDCKVASLLQDPNKYGEQCLDVKFIMRQIKAEGNATQMAALEEIISYSSNSIGKRTIKEIIDADFVLEDNETFCDPRTLAEVWEAEQSTLKKENHKNEENMDFIDSLKSSSVETRDLKEKAVRFADPSIEPIIESSTSLFSSTISDLQKTLDRLDDFKDTVATHPNIQPRHETRTMFPTIEPRKSGSQFNNTSGFFAEEQRVPGEQVPHQAFDHQGQYEFHDPDPYHSYKQAEYTNMRNMHNYQNAQTERPASRRTSSLLVPQPISAGHNVNDQNSRRASTLFASRSTILKKPLFGYSTSAYWTGFKR